MENKNRRTLKWSALAVGAAFALSAQAGERTWDFETDPFDDFEYVESNQLDFIWGGQGFDDWGAEGNPGGFFSITEATEGTSTIAVLPDIDNGDFVKAFTMTMDLRIGNGTTDRPADGISINFARASDPMLEDVQGGSAIPGNAATGGAAETGTQTGVAISFDTWAGNALPDGPDIEGIIVRVDNKTVGRFAMPTRHGAPDDITSLQTGPIGGSDAAPDAERGDPTILSWQPLEVSVDELGVLNVTYKGNKLVDSFSSGFFPSPGQIILMGRTGGANEAHHVDNLVLKTELAESWLVAGLDGTANGFTFSFRDVGNSQVDPDTIVILLDGVDVSDQLEKTKDGEFTHATYVGDDLFEGGSTHVVEVTASGNDGRSTSVTAEFTAPDYSRIPADLALEGVDTSTRGFLLFIKQSETGVGTDTPSRLAHLADDSENVADDFESDDYTWTVDLINFDQDGNAQGEFRDGAAGALNVIDDFIPGIPGFTDSTDNITGYIQTVARIPEAGFYTFGFNSDDGFQTTFGNDKASEIIVGGFSGGRGASTTEYQVYFEAAGDYAVQSLWYEGGGGANFEWFTISPNKALLNDTANGGIQTFATLPNVPARITSVTPGNGSTGVVPNTNVTVTIEDAAASVDAGSVSLTLSDGSTGTASKSGGVTTVTVDRGGAVLGAGEVVDAELKFTAGGNEQTYNFSFTALDYPTLSKGKTDVGTGSDAGFEFRIYQTVAGRGNNTSEAEQQLAGTWADGEENVADPAGGTVSTDDARPGVIFNVDVINFDQDGAAQGVFRDSGDGSSTDRADDFIPGIPGLGEGDATNNMSAEILSFIEFPAAGYYQMIFNSDDGFRVTETHGAGDAAGVELGVFEGGRGAADTVFGFAVVEAGVYPIRAIWYEGGGGANLEWSTTAGGNRWLINDSDANALKAYRTRTGTPVDIDLGSDGGAISSVGLTDGNVVIEYTGTLKSSESVTGPYNAVAGAASPYSVEPTKAAEFYIAE
jgi:hypothetical protein